MNAKRNSPGQLEIIRVSLQAREILSVPEQERSTNDCLLRTWLGKVGLGVSSRALNDLLDRLDKEGLVSTEEVEMVRVIHLRRFGGEVARGLETLDWIARPELPD